MSYGILGPLDVRTGDGAPVAVGGPGVRALLALLLTDPGRVMPVARLIDGLYGEDPPPTAANALQAQVSRLRRALGAAGHVAHTPAGYRLDADPGDVDAHRFARLAAEGHQALSGDPARAADVLRTALDLWRGPALADVTAPFAVAEARRLDDLRLTAREDHAEALLALGDPGPVVTDLGPLTTDHPLRERPRGLLMRALHATGRTAEALALYDRTRRLLADELGADPSPHLAAIHLSLLRAEPPAAPGTAGTGAPPPPIATPGSAPYTPGSAPNAPGTPNSTRSAPGAPGPVPPGPAPYGAPAGDAPIPAPARIPAPLTSFIGRDGELARIGDLLGAARLVTLTGPGGAGKTRLAVEAAARTATPAAFVDLAPVDADPARAVLGALGLRDAALRQPSAPSADVTDRLSAALADRDLLIVLDNCEHVVDAAARLAHRLLGDCPGLRILATSREPLAITGEALCPVPPLPAGAEESPAVRLFADRAAAVHPGFTIDTTTRDAVLRICRALDGLPLAIELAAARLRTLPVTDIADRLDDRFALLTRGDRTAAPRHRTLRAVVGWSWDLLTPDEQALARRLTVLPGGATPEAARTVSGLPDAADRLDDLAEKSLLDASGGRYRMLETIRAYGAEELRAHGETDRVQHALAAYVLDLAERADPHLRGADQLTWLDRLTAERANLLAATRWAAAHDTALALRLVAMLSPYWYLRGMRGEVAPVARRVLDDLGEPPADRADEYILCVATALSGPEPEELRAHVARAQDLLYGMDRMPRLPFAVVLWAVTAGPPRTPIDRDRIGELLGGDPWSAALLHVGQGFTYLYGGDVTAAEKHFAQAVDGYRAVGDRWGMTQGLDQLAVLADWRGEHDRCRALIDETIGLLTELGALEDTGDVLCRRGDCHVRAGDLDAALRDYDRALDLFRRTGAVDRRADVLRGRADVARLRGDLDAARRGYEEVTGGAPTVFGASDPQLAAWVGLGRVAEAEGDAVTARTRHRAALHATASWHLPLAARAVEGLAGAALLDDDPRQAAHLHGLAIALRGARVHGDPDVTRVTTAARTRLGDPTYTDIEAAAAARPQPDALTELGIPPHTA